jgi:hypothetical protein
MLEFFVFNVGIIRINLRILFIKSNFFSFKFVISKSSHFFLNLHYFFHFFPNQNCKVRKIQNQKNMLVVEVAGGGGVIQLFKAKILPN